MADLSYCYYYYYYYSAMWNMEFMKIMAALSLRKCINARFAFAFRIRNGSCCFNKLSVFHLKQKTRDAIKKSALI